MLEKYIERSVVHYAESKGFLVRKLYSRGMPDRMFISPTGFVGFIEFKQKEGKLSKLQKKTFWELNDRNIDVRIGNDIDLGKLTIDEWLQYKPNNNYQL